MTPKHLGKTPAHRRALDEIGGGNYSPAMAESTKKALLGAGLIEKCGVRKFGAGWSAAHVDMFEMPTPVHIRWCDFHQYGEAKVQK